MMRAIILAAGYGTRLWPLTIDRAKPAIPFMGRPLVGYVAEYLARFGCHEIGVNLHHRAESVQAALGDGSAFGVQLEYFPESTILGTSGALDNARAFLDRDTFIVINGKIATDIDLSAALATHRRTGALATLVLRPNEWRERYTIINVRDDLYLGLGGFPPSDNDRGAPSVPLLNESESEIRNPKSEIETPLMFTGIHILEPRIFDFIPRGVFSDSITDVYPRAMQTGARIAAHVGTGMWHELSTVQRYLDTSIELMKHEGRDVELGAGSIVAAGASVHDAVLWENVHIEEGARVRRAVLGAGVRIPRGETIEDACVVRADLVSGVERPAKGLPGTMRGANFVAPLAR
ncbi:MAG: sugar phosphate nucleotidyltransferase [Pyrinomonadaceae bacterium]